MSSRQQAYGFSKEAQDKVNNKYSAKDEGEINQWFGALGLPTQSGPGREAFAELLHDGQILCQLANILSPNSIRKVHNPATIKIAAMRSMKMQENISFFLNWCTTYGLQDFDRFQTVDLFESMNLAMVQMTLFKLGGLSKKKGFNGPSIGVVVADVNKRNFTEEQLRKGQAIASKQMGNNQGASQAGMTGYGQGRQIIDSTANKYRADQSTIGLQYGSNTGASQAGMTAPGATRQIIDQTSTQYKADTSTPNQVFMGSNQGATQSGMTAPGTSRQIL